MNSGMTSALGSAPLRTRGFVPVNQNCLGTPYHVLFHGGSLKTGLALMGRARTSSSGYQGPFNYDWAGALTAVPPDGQYNGNARGQNAVDWQMAHSSNSVVTCRTQVASGNFSVVGGGINNTASGLNSCVPGGSTNTASNNNSFAAGASCIASGVAGVSCGSGNTASGNYSAAFGSATTASGAYSFACGNATQATTTAAFAFGIRALASRYGQLAHAAGQFAAVGDAQAVRFVLRIKTTDATPTTMMLDGSSTRLTIPSGKVLSGQLLVQGVKSDGSAVARYERDLIIKNVAGTTTLVTSATLGLDYEDNVLTDITPTADDTNDALQINVTGIAAETWRWTGVLTGVETAYGS